MNPLEKINAKRNRICCNNCKNHIVTKGASGCDIDACEVDGRLILEMHLDTPRTEQCNSNFKLK